MKKHLFPLIILIAYSLILLRIMVFKVVPVIRSGPVRLDFGGTNGGNPPNFVPFSTIMPYLLGENGLTIAYLNIVGNIALLVPIGFIVPLVYQSMTWKKSLILAIFSSLAIEILQVILHVGIFDIDDVLLNALGVMIGFFACKFFTKWVREKKYLFLSITALFLLLAAVGSYAIVYPHEPYRVNIEQNATTGQFRGVEVKEGNIPNTSDLCNGTGGTGSIVSVRKNAITIKSRAGVTQIIGISDQTLIKNSQGAISASDLNVGQRVTIVIEDSKTASAVFVCNAAPNTQSEK